MNKATKKMGRPTDNPRNKRIEIRIAESELELLNECAKLLNTSRANVIVQGIQMVTEQLKKQK